MQKKGVAACLKHFAANSQERDRCDESSEIDERTLRKIYLKAFEIAVKKSNPASVMCAYNKINSIWCSENKMLLAEILRDEWNYDGFVVSDWGAGGAIADVLSGKVNPSGKLPETFPTAQRQDIDYPGDGLKVEYREKLNVGYRYYDKHTDEIGYPFGHGLSYTKFEYKNGEAVLDNDTIKISLGIENTGDYDGAEVVQVYAADPASTATKPIKELKAFKKVFVKR